MARCRANDGQTSVGVGILTRIDTFLFVQQFVYKVADRLRTVL